MTLKGLNQFPPSHHHPCVLCGSVPTDRCHIKTKGSGGTWDESNILRFCRFHHQVQHKIGWRMMTEKYPDLIDILSNKGWELENVFGIWKLVRIVT